MSENPTEPQVLKYIEWINSQLKNDISSHPYLPIKKTIPSLLKACQNGYLLYRLIDKCKPIIDNEAIIPLQDDYFPLIIEFLQNQGVDIISHPIETPEFIELIKQVIKTTLLYGIEQKDEKGLNPIDNDELNQHIKYSKKQENENEMNLIDWINKTLKTSNNELIINNLECDLLDVLGIGHLINIITKKYYKKQFILVSELIKEPVFIKRAEKVLEICKVMGLKYFIEPKDFLKGSDMIVLFLGVLRCCLVHNGVPNTFILYDEPGLENLVDYTWENELNERVDVDRVYGIIKDMDINDGDFIVGVMKNMNELYQYKLEKDKSYQDGTDLNQVILNLKMENDVLKAKLLLKEQKSGSIDQFGSNNHLSGNSPLTGIEKSSNWSIAKGNIEEGNKTIDTKQSLVVSSKKYNVNHQTGQSNSTNVQTEGLIKPTYLRNLSSKSNIEVTPVDIQIDSVIRMDINLLKKHIKELNEFYEKPNDSNNPNQSIENGKQQMNQLSKHLDLLTIKIEKSFYKVNALEASIKQQKQDITDLKTKSINIDTYSSNYSIRLSEFLLNIDKVQDKSNKQEFDLESKEIAKTMIKDLQTMNTCLRYENNLIRAIYSCQNCVQNPDDLTVLQSMYIELDELYRTLRFEHTKLVVSLNSPKEYIKSELAAFHLMNVETRQVIEKTKDVFLKEFGSKPVTSLINEMFGGLEKMNSYAKGVEEHLEKALSGSLVASVLLSFDGLDLNAVSERVILGVKNTSGHNTLKSGLPIDSSSPLYSIPSPFKTDQEKDSPLQQTESTNSTTQQPLFSNDLFKKLLEERDYIHQEYTSLQVKYESLSKLNRNLRKNGITFTTQADNQIYSKWSEQQTKLGLYLKSQSKLWEQTKDARLREEGELNLQKIMNHLNTLSETQNEIKILLSNFNYNDFNHVINNSALSFEIRMLRNEYMKWRTGQITWNQSPIELMNSIDKLMNDIQPELKTHMNHIKEYIETLEQSNQSLKTTIEETQDSNHQLKEIIQSQEKKRINFDKINTKPIRNESTIPFLDIMKHKVIYNIDELLKESIEINSPNQSKLNHLKIHIELVFESLVSKLDSLLRINDEKRENMLIQNVLKSESRFKNDEFKIVFIGLQKEIEKLKVKSLFVKEIDINDGNDVKQDKSNEMKQEMGIDKQDKSNEMKQENSNDMKQDKSNDIKQEMGIDIKQDYLSFISTIFKTFKQIQIQMNYLFEDTCKKEMIIQDLESEFQLFKLKVICLLPSFQRDLILESNQSKQTLINESNQSNEIKVKETNNTKIKESNHVDDMVLIDLIQSQHQKILSLQNELFKKSRETDSTNESFYEKICFDELDNSFKLKLFRKIHKITTLIQRLERKERKHHDHVSPVKDHESPIKDKVNDALIDKDHESPIKDKVNDALIDKDHERKELIDNDIDINDNDNDNILETLVDIEKFLKSSFEQQIKQDSYRNYLWCMVQEYEKNKTNIDYLNTENNKTIERLTTEMASNEIEYQSIQSNLKSFKRELDYKIKKVSTSLISFQNVYFKDKESKKKVKEKNQVNQVLLKDVEEIDLLVKNLIESTKFLKEDVNLPIIQSSNEPLELQIENLNLKIKSLEDKLSKHESNQMDWKLKYQLQLKGIIKSIKFIIQEHETENEKSNELESKLQIIEQGLNQSMISESLHLKNKKQYLLSIQQKKVSIDVKKLFSLYSESIKELEHVYHYLLTMNSFSFNTTNHIKGIQLFQPKKQQIQIQKQAIVMNDKETVKQTISLLIKNNIKEENVNHVDEQIQDYFECLYQNVDSLQLKYDQTNQLLNCLNDKLSIIQDKQGVSERVKSSFDKRFAKNKSLSLGSQVSPSVNFKTNNGLQI